MPQASSHRPRRPLHLTDHLIVLRRHWLAAGLAFLVVVGGIVARTMVATPVYGAAATIHLTDAAGGGSVLEELTEVERPSPIETEMEVMRSYSVARGAARILAAGPGASEKPEFVFPAKPEDAPLAHAPVHVVEINAFRPWEVFLRGWGVGRKPGPPLTVKTPILAPGVRSISFTLAFDRDATHVTVTPSGRKPVIVAYTPGQPIEAAERAVLLAYEDEDLGGRTYTVNVMSEDVAAHWIHRGAAITPVGRYTGIVQIGFQSDTPTVARDVADSLAKSYLAMRLLQRKGEVESGFAWVQAEVKRLEGVLREKEEALDAFVRDKGAVHLGERASAMLVNMATLEADLSKFSHERAHLEFQRGRLTGEMPLDRKLRIANSTSDPVTLAHATEFVEMERQLDVFIKHEQLTDEHPKVLLLKRQMAQTRKQLESAADDMAQARVESLDQQIATLQRREKEARAVLNKNEAEMDRLPTVERGLARLKRDVESIKAIHSQLVARKMQLEMAKNSSHVSARLLDAAQVPLVRSSPRLFHKGVMGLLLGVLAAVGLAFFLEYLDRRIKSPQELEEGLGVPIYAAIPAFKSVRRRERRGLKGALVVAKKPNSLLAEAYRSLRANIQFADADKEVRVMAITSALPQEGKTVTTLNLATTMAQAGSSVLVVDADLRRPATHVHLGGELSPGVTDVLSGMPWQEAVRETIVPNLHLIPAGQRVANPGALLDADRLSELLADFREAYDYVLFDVPPILAVADAAAFFRQLDGVLLLVQYHRSRLDVVEGARDQVVRMGGRLLGVVFNAYDARRSSQSGYGRYGYGDKYSAYSGDPDRDKGRRSRDTAPSSNKG